MREILFRGKRLDNGEWLTGDLRHWRNGKVGIHDETTKNTIAVDPSAVGQYTGLKDKNGKRIFEGDILGSRYDDVYPDNVTIEVVMWFRNGWHVQQGDYDPELLEYDDYLPYSEIIGNLHENPELLEGGASE